MTLTQGIAVLGLALSPAAQDRLAAYLRLLEKWNKVYNLTAIRNPAEMVTHHVLDALTVLPVIERWIPTDGQAGRFCLADVGSGAGVPGLLLGIVHPEWDILSIEAVGKKAAFQRQVKIELALDNVEVRAERVEAVQHACTAVIARAYASLADFAASAGHLATTLWAMKGAYPVDELAALPTAWRCVATHELFVPGLSAQRHLLQLERS